MKKMLIIEILLISILLGGCQIIQSMQPVAQPAESGTLLFADEFNDNSNNWGTAAGDTGSITFAYQGLDIKVNLPDSLLWTVSGKKYSDVKIDLDGVLLTGPSNDVFGVICRFQDNDHFYGFLISHDGYYGIFKMEEGKLVLANTQEGLKYSEAIRLGGGVNHIEAVCQGDRLSLTVNGELLSEIQDNTYTAGQVGVVAGTYATGGVEVFFDNLKVYQP